MVRRSPGCIQHEPSRRFPSSQRGRLQDVGRGEPLDDGPPRIDALVDEERGDAQRDAGETYRPLEHGTTPHARKMANSDSQDVQRRALQFVSAR